MVQEVTAKTTGVGYKQTWVVKGSRKSNSKLIINTSVEEAYGSEQVCIEEKVNSLEGNKENVFMEEEHNEILPTANKFDALMEMDRETQSPVVVNSGQLTSSTSLGVNGSAGNASLGHKSIVVGISKGKALFKGRSSSILSSLAPKGVDLKKSRPVKRPLIALENV